MCEPRSASEVFFAQNTSLSEWVAGSHSERHLLVIMSLLIKPVRALRCGNFSREWYNVHEVFIQWQYHG